MAMRVLCSNLFSRSRQYRFTAITHSQARHIHKIVSSSEELDILAHQPPSRIRNFSIIAHIDHGKSTLADCLLNFTGNISSEQRGEAQVLDNLEVERQRGITVKAQTASLFYRLDEQGIIDYPDLEAATYILNLIDTPGHVDFAYEVRKSLDACEGALLLVDSAQGIQAQTLANYTIAKAAGLKMIPVMTKTDLPASQPDVVLEQMQNLFGFEADEVLRCSAKSGAGVDMLFPEIIRRFPAPTVQPEENFQALLFDSWHDPYRGNVCLIKVVAGHIKIGDKVNMYHKNGTYEIFEIGFLKPSRHPVPSLRSGQVGYIICNIKSAADIRLGDTVFKVADAGSNIRSIKQAAAVAVTKKKEITPLPGFQPARSMVFAGLFPSSSDEYDELRDAMDKITLSDPSVEVETESSVSLGLGYRCGFLGALHMEVFVQRLQQEYQMNCILTAPTVPYKADLANGQKIDISSPAHFPDAETMQVEKFYEPWQTASIITPECYTGPLMKLLDDHRGVLENFEFFSKESVHLTYQVPLAEVVSNMYTNVKAISSGFGSFDHTFYNYQPTSLTKVVIKINGEPVDAFSLIAQTHKAPSLAKSLCEKLKANIPRQQFVINIQATVGSKIIASEKIQAYRKDVLMKSGKTVGGGDMSRKKKLLERQKEGKKRMKYAGNVELSEKVFMAVVSDNKN